MEVCILPRNIVENIEKKTFFLLCLQVYFYQCKLYFDRANLFNSKCDALKLFEILRSMENLSLLKIKYHIIQRASLKEKCTKWKLVESSYLDVFERSRSANSIAYADCLHNFG